MGTFKLSLVALVAAAALVSASDPYANLSPAFVAEMNTQADALIKQLVGQQFAREEQVRADGHSGIKIMRARGEGTRPYHTATGSDDFTNNAIHDHTDFYNTCGMGEVQVVLNGVEFKTRHNDFLLTQKSERCHVYGASQQIPYPEVPASVLSQASLADQVAELKEYFVAWRDQNTTHRDYRPHFKANLCYMEGTWTKADPDTIQEAFFSERHWYEATSWDDMFQKTRFSSYAGTKENLENYAFMPTSIVDVEEDGTPVVGQWNYQMMCHPLQDDLPTNRLRAIDDLKTRMSLGLTYDEYLQGRNARFALNPVDRDMWCDEATKYGLLDKLMAQIPGFDNYGAHIEDESFGHAKKPFLAGDGDDTPLNAAYYHRWFQNKEAGAMGVKIRHRGLNDEHLWMAMNTRPNVLPTKVKVCDTYPSGNCDSWEQKWSYAIPMEIIYTTPLQSWNPYDIAYKGLEKTATGYTVYDGPLGVRSRDGTNSTDKAWDGTNSAKFYRTPVEFFMGGEIGDDPADTPDDFSFVLDSTNTPRKVRGSGLRTFLPAIEGVGTLRQRYTVNPIYGEGSPAYKELSALSDIVMMPSRYDYMIRDDADPACGPPGVLRLRSGLSQVHSINHPTYGVIEVHDHTHDVILSSSQQEALNEGQTVTVSSEMAHGHSHAFDIYQTTVEGDDGFITEQYFYSMCSGAVLCLDEHTTQFSVL